MTRGPTDEEIEEVALALYQYVAGRTALEDIELVRARIALHTLYWVQRGQLETAGPIVDALARIRKARHASYAAGIWQAATFWQSPETFDQEVRAGIAANEAASEAVEVGTLHAGEVFATVDHEPGCRESGVIIAHPRPQPIGMPVVAYVSLKNGLVKWMAADTRVILPSIC